MSKSLYSICETTYLSINHYDILLCNNIIYDYQKQSSSINGIAGVNFENYIIIAIFILAASGYLLTWSFG